MASQSARTKRKGRSQLPNQTSRHDRQSLPPPCAAAKLRLSGTNDPANPSACAAAMATERRAKPDNTTAPRKRALVSCDRCKLRRARCIRESPDEPCSDCKISGVSCESKLPRKQRVYGSVETLSLRYRALEALVKGLFPQENTQDVNVLFKLGAARNISMPAVDDYTPADIFNHSAPKQPTTPQQDQHQHQHQYQHQYQHQHQHQNQNQNQNQNQPGPAPQASVQNPATHAEASFTALPRDHPFFTDPPAKPHRHTAYPTSTRDGVPYEFGVSSSVHFATSMRRLMARYQAIPGVSLPQLPAHLWSDVEPSSKSARSSHRSCTNPSDEEPLCSIRNIPDPERVGRKRSRAQMEVTDERWEHRDGSPNPDTIGDLLPSRSLADALVAAYFDHIHVHLPLFNRGMFEFRLEATYSRKTERLKDCADVGWLVALALVFAFGCQQLQEHDPEQAHKLRLKYLSFARGYLRRVLIDTCLFNVQALVLLNLHHHTVGQKSSSWLTIGLAARMAITMGMHRDDPNLELDPIEQNTRRQVFWSIYTFERILCSILGRPTVIDDTELCIQMPEAPMIEESSMSTEYMAIKFELTQLSYNIRQGAYFHKNSKQEHPPSLEVAAVLLRQCDAFFVTIPTTLKLDFSPVPPEQQVRILSLHVYYYYTRCIVSRAFLIQKVERNISSLETNSPTPSKDWQRTLLISEDCVDSAHKMLECILAGADLGMVSYSWLDLFFIVHSILIVCTDFLARPQQQQDSAKDSERRNAVRAVLSYVRSLKKQAPTYKVLNQIAEQFAGMTGVVKEEFFATLQLQSSMSSDDETTHHLGEISDIQDDWFANATMTVGLQFSDLVKTKRPMSASMLGITDSKGGQAHGVLETHPTAGQMESWTERALRGMHTT